MQGVTAEAALGLRKATLVGQVAFKPTAKLVGRPPNALLPPAPESSPVIGHRLQSPSPE